MKQAFKKTKLYALGGVILVINLIGCHAGSTSGSISPETFHQKVYGNNVTNKDIPIPTKIPTILEDYLKAIQLTKDGVKWKAPDPLNVADVINFFIGLIPLPKSVYDKDYYQMQQLQLQNEKLMKLMKNFDNFVDIYNQDQTAAHKKDFFVIQRNISNIGTQLNSFRVESMDIVTSYEIAKQKGYASEARAIITTNNLGLLKNSAEDLTSTEAIKPFFNLMQRQIKRDGDLNQNIVDYNRAVLSYGGQFAMYLSYVNSIELQALQLKKTYPDDFAKTVFSEDFGGNVNDLSYAVLEKKLNTIFVARNKMLIDVVTTSLIQESDIQFIAQTVGLKGLENRTKDFKIINYESGILKYEVGDTNGEIDSNRCDDSSDSLFIIAPYSGMVVCNNFKTGRAQKFKPNRGVDAQARKGLLHDVIALFQEPTRTELAAIFDSAWKTSCYDDTEDYPTWILSQPEDLSAMVRYNKLTQEEQTLSAIENRFWVIKHTPIFQSIYYETSPFMNLRHVTCQVLTDDLSQGIRDKVVTKYSYSEVYMPNSAYNHMGRFLWDRYSGSKEAIKLVQINMGRTAFLALNGATPPELFRSKMVRGSDGFYSEQYITKSLIGDQFWRIKD